MTKKILKNKFSGFTLIELMIGLAIFSLIMTMILSSVHSMTLARIKNMNRIALTDQLYLFSEQLFTTIKNGGTIDYEEYWNRNSFDTETSFGHYKKPSGMGNYGDDGDLGSNFWKNFYYCLSGNGVFMGTNGCLESNNSENISQKWNMQRFGQYELQFWDMNGNQNGDSGDEDRNNEIIGDEDDFNLWNGPEVFAKNNNEYIEPIELYLIDKQKKKRTFLRWRLITDPRSKAGEICDKDANGNWNEHCLGNIQILKMDGYDLWLGHNSNSNDLGLYDGKIDTWVCETGWNCQWWDSTAGQIATGKNEEWINLFPADINVRNFRIDIYPKKDPWLAAADSDCPQNNSSNSQCISPFIHPYVRFTLELGFAKWARRSLQWENPIISISSTISLDDFR